MTADQGTAAARKLPSWAWLIVAIAVLIVIGEMAGGYVESFINLEKAARHAGWKVPWLLPLEADAPILAYVILDQVSAVLGARARALHYVAWGLAAATVLANYGVAPASSQTWRLIYAAMPAGWVLGTEALRWFWKIARSGPAAPRDRIPAGRWIADPRGTRQVQWRMWLLGETSWQRMSAIEDARAIALDVVRELEGSQAAPAYLLDRIEAARMPGAVLDAIDGKAAPGVTEDLVRRWVTSALTLPELSRAALLDAQREAAPGPAPDEPGPEAAHPARATRDEPAHPAHMGRPPSGEPPADEPPRPRPARTPSPQPLARDAESEEARKAYRESAEAGTPISRNALARKFGRSNNWAQHRIDEVKNGPHLAKAQ